MGNKKDIEALTNDILDIYNKIGENVNKILDQKDNINSKLSYKLDDFIFYNSLIDNCVFYYTKSKDIRFKKLLKDFNNVIEDFNKISYNNKVISNYNFDLGIVTEILDAYDKCKEYKDNNIHWMKEKHEIQDWAIELKKLLIYHRHLIKSLYDSLICQVNFFTKKKKDDDIASVTSNEMYFCSCKFPDDEEVRSSIANVGCMAKKSNKVNKKEIEQNFEETKQKSITVSKIDKDLQQKQEITLKEELDLEEDDSN